MHQIREKSFSSEECNSIRNILYNIFLEKDTISEKEIKFINQSVLSSAYHLAKKKKNWQRLYDQIPIKLALNDFITDKLFNIAKLDGILNPKLISVQCRMLDVDDSRSYPLHQDWPGIELSSLMIYWIPLHDIDLGEGGLNIIEEKLNSRREHVVAENGYPILSKEECKDLNNKIEEIPMKEGDCLGFDGLTIHGSARKLSGPTRFALIYRIA